MKWSEQGKESTCSQWSNPKSTIHNPIQNQSPIHLQVKNQSHKKIRRLSSIEKLYFLPTQLLRRSFYPSLPHIIIYWNQISTLAWDGISSAGIAICRQRKHAFLSKTNKWRKQKHQRRLNATANITASKLFRRNNLVTNSSCANEPTEPPSEKACHLWIEPQYIPWLHGVEKK